MTDDKKLNQFKFRVSHKDIFTPGRTQYTELSFGVTRGKDLDFLQWCSKAFGGEERVHKPFTRDLILRPIKQAQKSLDEKVCVKSGEHWFEMLWFADGEGAAECQEGDEYFTGTWIKGVSCNYEPTDGVIVENVKLVAKKEDENE